MKQRYSSTKCHEKIICDCSHEPQAFGTNYSTSSCIAPCSVWDRPGRQLQTLQQEATNTYKRVNFSYGQRTSKVHHNKLREKRSKNIWMLIISFSASVGFPGCRGSQVAFSLCLWFPSETMIALGNVCRERIIFLHVRACNKCQFFFWQQELVLHTHH